jgi:site-specific recombinase XerD
MSYVTRRSDSSSFQFRYRIPQEVADRVKGRQITIWLPDRMGAPPVRVTTTISHEAKFSLATTDRDTANARAIVALEHLRRWFDATKAGPMRLKGEELAALSKHIYDAFDESFRDDPGSVDRWIAFKAWTRAAMEGRIARAPAVHADLTKLSDESALAAEAFGNDLTASINSLPKSESTEALEQRFGVLVDWVLVANGIELDLDQRTLLLRLVARAAHQAARQLKKRADYDFSPDPEIGRFPDIQISKPAAPSATLSQILKDWWVDAKKAGRKPSTYESYAATIESLKTFLKHDDARKVTPEKVVEFKDHRLTKVSAKTVKDSDLAALKTIFGWAVTNRRINNNPATGITIKLGKRKVGRKKGFTDTEAAALLNASDDLKKGNEQPKTFAAKRWVPWLCAYTGARVGEMAQLRKEDIRREAGQWVIHIDPEAGTVKTDEPRDVVMHPHLVEKGFPAFVQSCGKGHLFLTPAADGDVLGPLQGVKNRLAEEARETVKDTRVQPNNGWRHRFKSIVRSVGIDKRVADYIQGHAPATVGDEYGEVEIAAMALAMSRFPRCDLSARQADDGERDAVAAEPTSPADEVRQTVDS